MNDETVEQLQTKIAYLERAAAELSDVVFRQQQEIQALSARIERALEGEQAHRIGATERSPGDRLMENEGRLPEFEKPPHY